MAKSLPEQFSLERPLLVFDTETTGLSVSFDRIIQLAYIKYGIDGSMEEKTYLFNPQMPIPASATAVHGLTDESVKDAPLFKDVAEELFEIFSGCIFSGFNVIGYDLPLLRQEFSRCGKDFTYSAADIIDAKAIYHYFEPRTLSSAYRYYCGKEHTEAHDAMADVKAAAEILRAQIDQYGVDKIKEIQASSAVEYVDADRKFYWRDGQVCFAFAKHRHRPLAAVVESEPGYLEWMLAQDFSPEVKKIIKDALSGIFPSR